MSENNENNEPLDNEPSENTEQIIDISDLERYSQESSALFEVDKSHLQSILKAIAGGEKIVKFGDRYVEYRSVDELLKAKNLIEAELARQQTPRRNKLTRLYSKGKGWSIWKGRRR